MREHHRDPLWYMRMGLPHLRGGSGGGGSAVMTVPCAFSCLKLYDPPLDSGIERAVQILVTHGIETYESCEGGEGHPFAEPTVRFFGSHAEGFKAVAVAIQNGLKPSALRRFWSIIDDEPTGPNWEIVF